MNEFDDNLTKSLEDFMESYKMVDVEQIYSNGTEFVPIFRVKQWLEYNNINNLQSKIDKAYAYLDKFIPNEWGVLLTERQWNYVKSILKEEKDETNNNE